MNIKKCGLSEYCGGRCTHVCISVQVGLAKTLAVVQYALICVSAANSFNDGGPYIVVSVAVVVCQSCTRCRVICESVIGE